MNTIKTYKKDKYNLEHSTYIDDFGMMHNFIEAYFYETEGENKGMRINVPIHPLIRISNAKLGEVYIGDDTTPYTDEEYDEMITRGIKYIN